MLVRARAIANAKEKGRSWRDERVSGGRKIGWPERPVAARGPRCWGNARLVTPSLIAHRTYVHQVENTNVRGEIQQGCENCTVPSQGWSYPTLDGRSTLRAHPRFFCLTISQSLSRHTAVLQLLQARCVLHGAITGHLGPYLPGPFESSHYRRRQYRETRIFGLYR